MNRSLKKSVLFAPFLFLAATQLSLADTVVEFAAVKKFEFDYITIMKTPHAECGSPQKKCGPSFVDEVISEADLVVATIDSELDFLIEKARQAARAAGLAANKTEAEIIADEEAAVAAVIEQERIAKERFEHLRIRLESERIQLEADMLTFVRVVSEEVSVSSKEVGCFAHRVEKAFEHQLKKDIIIGSAIMLTTGEIIMEAAKDVTLLPWYMTLASLGATYEVGHWVFNGTRWVLKETAIGVGCVIGCTEAVATGAVVGTGKLVVNTGKVIFQGAVYVTEEAYLAAHAITHGIGEGIESIGKAFLTFGKEVRAGFHHGGHCFGQWLKNHTPHCKSHSCNDDTTVIVEHVTVTVKDKVKVIESDDANCTK